METNNLFRRVGIDFLFENATIPNVGDIDFNNFESFNIGYAKAGQGLDISFYFLDNGSVKSDHKKAYNVS
jgi:hypothetical protein